MITQSSHSSKVQIWLVVAETRLDVAQVGPDGCILRQTLDAPPSVAELFIEIDGDVKRQPVYLPQGISKDSTSVALRRE